MTGIKFGHSYCMEIYGNSLINLGVLLAAFAQARARQLEEPGSTSQRSSEKIPGLLRNSPTLTAREMAQQLGTSQRAVEKQIEKLKRDGSLRRIGSDKDGYRAVLETL